MYLKVPYIKENGETRFATVEEVQAAANEIAPDLSLTVDNDLNYPSVNFVDGTPYQAYKHVEAELVARGFEVS